MQNNSSGYKWRETAYLCVEVINSNKRQFTGKSGRVVQIHV